MTFAKERQICSVTKNLEVKEKEPGLEHLQHPLLQQGLELRQLVADRTELESRTADIPSHSER